MRSTHLSKKLTDHTTAKQPVMIWGPPGVGKSAVVAQVAKNIGAELIDLRAVLLDPTDIRGIPYVVDGAMKISDPAVLPNARSKKKFLLFLDEIVAAPPATQAALFQLILDRKIGTYTLPDGVVMVAAGNRATDRSGANRMLAALSNRFIHYDFDVNLDDWCNWALKRQKLSKTSGRSLAKIIV